MVSYYLVRSRMKSDIDHAELSVKICIIVPLIYFKKHGQQFIERKARYHFRRIG
jgi:hypothetical protein